MKKHAIVLVALVVANVGALDRKRVLRWRGHGSDKKGLDELKVLVESEREAMEAFGRFLQTSAILSSSYPPKTIVEVSSAPTSVPDSELETKTPTSSPVANGPDTTSPAPTATQQETPAQSINELAGSGGEDIIVETRAEGPGVAVPLLSVLGVVGIASVFVARRSYLAAAAAEADSQLSEDSSQEE